MANAKYFTHTFSDGTTLEAFSVDPNTDPEEMTRESLKGKPLGESSLEELAKLFPIPFDVDDLRKIKTTIVDNPYHIPEVLKPFAQEVITEQLRRNPSMFPGPIMAYQRDGDEIVLRRANYFDFLATNRAFDCVPAGYANNPHHLPEGKTLAEIVSEGKIITRGEMVNYLGQAFPVVADGQLGIVQRAKGLGIVAGVPALAGGTPPFDDYATRADAMLRGVELSSEAREKVYVNARKQFGPNSKKPVGFFAPDFSFPGYIAAETAKEMKEEFLLEPDEFRVICYMLTENLTTGTASTPSIATVIVTDKSWSKIADHCYGNAGVIKEHPVIYAVEASPSAMKGLINGMSMHDATAYLGYKAVEKLSTG